MAGKIAVIMFTLFVSTLAQRPSYAGRRPIGYPQMEVTTNSQLSNKFGEGTTQTLPIEALGDVELYNRVMSMPVDNRLFWALNSEAIAAMRDTPKTYPQRQSGFNDFQGVGWLFQ